MRYEISVSRLSPIRQKIPAFVLFPHSAILTRTKIFIWKLDIDKYNGCDWCDWCDFASDAIDAINAIDAIGAIDATDAIDAMDAIGAIGAIDVNWKNAKREIQSTKLNFPACAILDKNGYFCLFLCESLFCALK